MARRAIKAFDENFIMVCYLKYDRRSVVDGWEDEKGISVLSSLDWMDG